eukprot:TRINITY_DN362_c3_g1_i2.p1 TRINITY_DN362_c3_g1~~TRINITY_DN362_c3_g1_i2.p1  ORF type:complete len:651 (-),score=218.64 TRINITY_DN362_c3_g1_i2:748-2700(-)
MLEEEFTQLESKKDQINIETKVRNIRFLGELVKFRICTREVIFGCLKACLDDFAHHNIDVACNLLETCGQFLYRSPETHVRTKNMLEVMMRLKNVRNLDIRMDTMVENAYYQCIPHDRRLARPSKRTPVQEYIRHLVLSMDKENVKLTLKRLRKLHWEECEDYIVQCLLKVHHNKYVNIPLVASIASGLAVYHDALRVKLVDSLTEDIRVGLEKNEIVMQQRRVMQVKLLGELYNYSMFEYPLIFDTLYLFVVFGHDAETGGGVSGAEDGPLDHFRVRLVCTLLTTCGQYFQQGSLLARLKRFIAYFQRYLLSKANIPMDVEFMLQDTFEQLPSRPPRLHTLEEVEKYLRVVDEQPQQQVQGQGQGKRQRRRRQLEEERTRQNKKQQQPQQKEQEQVVKSKKKEEEEKVIFVEKENKADESEESEEESEDDEEEEEEELYQQKDGENGEQEDEEEEEGRGQQVEDEEFTRELNKMIGDSLASGRSRHESLRIELPYSVELAGMAAEQANQARGAGAEKPDMQFKVLLKKGHKAQAKDLFIPTTCRLAQASQSLQLADKEKQEELKRDVMRILEESEKASAVAADAARGGSSQRRRGGGRGGRRAQCTTHILAGSGGASAAMAHGSGASGPARLQPQPNLFQQMEQAFGHH